MQPLKSLALSLILFGSSVTSAAEPTEFIPLFNGHNLEGWQTGPDNAWVVEDGMMTPRREYDGQEHNLDYLWTQQTYGDFVLELEFKVAANTNSGVYLRTADRKDPVYTGIEVQVANSFGRDELSRTSTAGAIYDCAAPQHNAVKPPGEWNQYVITCQGPRLQVSLNDRTIVDMNLDQWTSARQNPDGTSNKFGTALKDFARRGYIGLQDHGRPVWYRNVRIKPLDP